LIITTTISIIIIFFLATAVTPQNHSENPGTLFQAAPKNNQPAGAKRNTTPHEPWSYGVMAQPHQKLFSLGEVYTPCPFAGDQRLDIEFLTCNLRAAGKMLNGSVIHFFKNISLFSTSWVTSIDGTRLFSRCS